MIWYAAISIALSLVLASRLRGRHRAELPTGMLPDREAILISASHVTKSIDSIPATVAVSFCMDSDLIHRANRMKANVDTQLRLFMRGKTARWQVIIDDGRTVHRLAFQPNGSPLPVPNAMRKDTVATPGGSGAGMTASAAPTSDVPIRMAAGVQPIHVPRPRRTHVMWARIGASAPILSLAVWLGSGLPLGDSALATAIAAAAAISAWAAIPHVADSIAASTVKNFPFGLAAAVRRAKRSVLAQGALVAATVGGGIAIGSGLLDVSQPVGTNARSAAAGVLAGSWLVSLGSIYYWALTRAGVTRMPAELSSSGWRAVGMRLDDPLVGAVQTSAIEEVTYRWLAPAALLTVGVPELVAWVAPTAVWVGSHPLGDVEPARWRLLELVILGLALALLASQFGILAALLGHFTFNFIVMSTPLLRPSPRTGIAS